MERLPGFIRGKPKVLEDLTMEFLKTCDDYFVEIKITNMGNKRAFPLTSYKTSKGVRLFTNNRVGKHMYVDRFSLEDLIEFREVSSEFLRG